MSTKNIIGHEEFNRIVSEVNSHIPPHGYIPTNPMLRSKMFDTVSMLLQYQQILNSELENIDGVEDLSFVSLEVVQYVCKTIATVCGNLLYKQDAGLISLPESLMLQMRLESPKELKEAFRKATTIDEIIDIVLLYKHHIEPVVYCFMVSTLPGIHSLTMAVCDPEKYSRLMSLKGTKQPKSNTIDMTSILKL